MSHPIETFTLSLSYIGSLWTRVKLNYREQWRVLVQAIRAETATQEVGAVETSRASSA